MKLIFDGLAGFTHHYAGLPSAIAGFAIFRRRLVYEIGVASFPGESVAFRAAFILALRHSVTGRSDSDSKRVRRHAGFPCVVLRIRAMAKHRQTR